MTCESDFAGAVLRQSPTRSAVHYYSGLALLHRGDAQGALAEIERDKSEFWRTIGLPVPYQARGRKADSDKALAAPIAKSEKDDSCNIAEIYAFRGEADNAFDRLGKAVEYGDPGLLGIVPERLIANIRSDPRWRIDSRVAPVGDSEPDAAQGGVT